MTCWEYDSKVVAHSDGTYSTTVHVKEEDWKAVCNAMGAQRWKLIETHGSVLRFERPIDEPKPETQPKWVDQLLALLGRLERLLERLCSR